MANFELAKRRNYTGLWVALAFGAGLMVGMLCKGGIGNNNGNMTNHYHWTDEDFPIPDVANEQGDPESCECGCGEESEDCECCAETEEEPETESEEDDAEAE